MIQRCAFGIYRIPEDVLCLIFEASAIRAPRDRMVFALDVSRVCHRWRAAALSAKAIWSYIHFSTHHHERDLALSRLFISRSGAQLLTVGIVDDAHRWNTRAEVAIMQLGPLLYDHRNRIASISISLLSKGVPLAAIFREFQDFSSTSLHDLSIVLDPALSRPNLPASATWSVPAASAFLGDLPSLRSLLLDRVYWHACPLRNLEHLSMRHLPVDHMDAWEIEMMTDRSPRLRSLELIDCMPPFGLPDKRRLVMAHLHTLAVSTHGRHLANTTTMFLPVIDARALRTMTLENHDTALWAPLWRLLHDVRPAWPSVVDLRIDTWALHPLFAAAFPALEALQIGVHEGRDIPLPDEQWQRVDAHAPGGEWPHLRALDIRAIFVEHNTAFLQTFLGARVVGTDPRMKLKTYPTQPELNIALSALIAAGSVVIDVMDTLD